MDLVDENRYLVLFYPEKYDGIYNRMRYLISVKRGFTYRETFCIILLKSVFNKYHNNYYYNIFLEKYLYQLANI